MFKSFFFSIIFFFLLFLTSCDAIVSMTYMVKNKTKQPLTLKVYGYHTCFGEIGKDTVLILAPGKEIGVSMDQKIDFPFGTKNIYRAKPGVENFDVMKNDTVVKIDKSDAHWKYKHKTSVFKIKTYMLKK